MADLIVYGSLVLLTILVAIAGIIVWIVRDLNREDDDAAAARKGEQSVEMWGRK